MVLFAYSGATQEKHAISQEKVAAADSIILNKELDDVTVTAFRVPYHLSNTPAPVHLISKVQLETGNALTPVEALNQVPGVFMHHGTLNTNRLTIRGIGSRTPYATNKLKAYLGEIPISGGDGETTIEDIDNPFLQKIEIIKGPSSSLYGAGLGGTLLLQPVISTKNYLQHQITAASFHTTKNTFSMGLDRQNLTVFGLGSLLESRGYRENNTTNRFNLMFHAEYKLSQKISLTALIRTTRMKAFIPSSIDWNTFLENPEKAAVNWKETEGYEEYDKGQIGGAVKILPDSHSKISIAAFGSYRNADELRPFNLLLEHSGYYGLRGYYQLFRERRSVKMTFTAGTELFREKYNWSTRSNHLPNDVLSDNRELRAYGNLFFQVETNIRKKLLLSSGINANLTRFIYTDHYLADGNQSGIRSFRPVFSPRLGANYRISEVFTCFGNISHGFSIPSFEETLLPEGAINPDIKPESGWNLETGLRAGLNNKIRAGISYYRIYIKNLLVARRTGEDAWVGVNAGKSIHPGLEAEIKWNVLHRHSYPSLVLSGNMTRTNYRFKHFIDNDYDYSGNLYPGTSQTTWLLTGQYKPVKSFTIKAWHRYTGKMPVNDSNSDFTEPYGLTNLEVTYTAAAGNFHFTVKTGVQNLFNVRYAAMLAINAPAFGDAPPRYYYPGHPRNYYLTLQISRDGIIASK